ncbi:NAD(P)H-dependent glycerol-3-phosphate dehydrogenase [Neotabrizicola shimadae]|uniref:Glycerol-3-phosphate dehydrogenase [NAD(P)+] n=1 Tax=Neotabrizicola shimadae TaxID=2807096 RepID=A0A8G0ZXH7_9RHOB|nr:NAD(P)H-dependent glycerol-3-phosphate dehydrogenase [Neotabrizicola shimadae]QYZ69864.1 NAD(P)-dependent glycerol-3-phosphate dehydrogenase [Neotabrizicola shimadae]
MIAVVGAGAFGTALAVVLAREGRGVTLWARDKAQVAAMRDIRRNDRLPGVTLPDNLSVTADLAAAARQPTILLCLPTQALGAFLDAEGPGWSGRLVACCKGVDLTTLRGPTALIERACPAAIPAIITGPSFAADIARGLPTALTLACTDEAAGVELQREMSTATLRLYRTADVTGAELGGALKNVIAIAAGVVIGAGLGESARAALMTRGYAEMVRLAIALGARAETLAGLSGFGDLVLTCSSDQSRNFRFGLSLGRGEGFDAKVTVEGAATARAVTRLSAGMGVEMPITAVVAALIAGDITVPQAMHSLLSRPLKQE